MINNAGVTDDALFLRMRESQWDNVIDVNLKGTFRITKAFIRHMIKAKKGKIIFLSSVVAASGNAGQVNYCASKAGIEAMCKSIVSCFAVFVVNGLLMGGGIGEFMSGELGNPSPIDSENALGRYLFDLLFFVIITI